MAKELRAESVARRLPARPEAGHKGTFGHVYIVAGSRGFTGAAKLTAAAAARSGCGLVTVGVPRPLGDVVAAGLLEPMSMMLPATAEESLAERALGPALAFVAGKDAAVVGPGLSQHVETVRFVHGFVRDCSVPLVIDADGLNALASDTDALHGASGIGRIVTPHPGEMARLMKSTAGEVQARRDEVAKTFAADRGCVVVLKGHRTVIAGPSGEAYVNPTGNSGLATGGTGDVLSGLIGGLLAQGLSPLDAAVVGVYIHGLAGDIAAEACTQRGMIAGDVIAAIPEAWRRLEERP
ncbi:MAG TPA: NAD(P)H-hydrate dehydratase [Candidatus Hydrogenedentes bacterium]|nr:NAD(P)H-hydrate dehydratase [Candidatus Hydrogenedentota bacterium]HPG69208.1 NAD(P)H-hydrate dehydratase [Candidatus Hydrogenedentota bacterium]